MKASTFEEKIYVKHLVGKYKEKTLLNKTKEELLTLLGVLNPTAAKLKAESTKPEIINELNSQLKFFNKDLNETKNRVLKKQAEALEKLYTFCDKSMKNNINNTPMEEVDEVYNSLLLKKKKKQTKEEKVTCIYEVYNQKVGELCSKLNALSKKAAAKKKTTVKKAAKQKVVSLEEKKDKVQKQSKTKKKVKEQKPTLKQEAAEVLKNTPILMFLQPDEEKYQPTVYLDKEEDVNLLKQEVVRFNNKSLGVQILPSVTVTRFQEKPKQFVNSLKVVKTKTVGLKVETEAVLFLELLKDLVGL